MFFNANVSYVERRLVGHEYPRHICLRYDPGTVSNDGCLLVFESCATSIVARLKHHVGVARVDQLGSALKRTWRHLRASVGGAPGRGGIQDCPLIDATAGGEVAGTGVALAVLDARAAVMADHVADRVRERAARTVPAGDAGGVDAERPRVAAVLVARAAGQGGVVADVRGPGEAAGGRQRDQERDGEPGGGRSTRLTQQAAAEAIRDPHERDVVGVRRTVSRTGV